MDLTSAGALPHKPGVYVIRVQRKGATAYEIIHNFTAVLEKMNWKPLMDSVMSRINRIKDIGDCPVIYIGSTRTLKGRYEDLCGRRHTTFFAILALIFSDWKLELGWKLAEEQQKEEKRLKEEYRLVHGRLPALVKT